jgi:heme A synthase
MKTVFVPGIIALLVTALLEILERRHLIVLSWFGDKVNGVIWFFIVGVAVYTIVTVLRPRWWYLLIAIPLYIVIAVGAMVLTLPASHPTAPAPRVESSATPPPRVERALPVVPTPSTTPYQTDSAIAEAPTPTPHHKHHK